jgi:hypothetical protein
MHCGIGAEGLPDLRQMGHDANVVRVSRKVATAADIGTSKAVPIGMGGPGASEVAMRSTTVFLEQ